MFRKILIVLICISLLISLFGCDDRAADAETVGADTVTAVPIDYSKIISDRFSAEKYFDVEEGSDLLDEEIKAIIANIPSDKYETYPDTHNAPVSATLYKNGEVISIRADDERLIRLINFFNNCVYYSSCSYIQSFLSASYVEENVTGCELRLELTYTPYGEKVPGAYSRCTTRSDMVVVTDLFTLIAHDLPGYEGRSEEYPFLAAGYLPLYDSYDWLELFGF
jgi:hypothetical protein